MKLTKETVAKALGWKISRPGEYFHHHGYRFRVKDPFGAGVNYIPDFTTSLEAIVAEIEARGLYWAVERLSLKQGRFKATVDLTPKYDSACEKTAPLALCAALLSYLKSEPK